MNFLKKYKLNELYAMGSGISSSKNQSGHGFPFLSFSTIFNNYIVPDTLPDLMDTSVKQRNEASIKKGDVFITRTSETPDELGMSCVALKDYPNATFSGFAKRLRPITNEVYPKYIAYYLRAPYFRKLIDANTIMTLRASFNDQIFSYLNIFLPDYDQQVKIGDMLYAIERKIMINNKINDNLQQLAEKYFDYWFLQYEFPSSNNKPYKSNNNMFSYNDLLKTNIPQGWKVINIRKLCDLIWGQCPNGENILPLNTKETEAMLYCSGAGDMRNGIVVDPQAKTNCSRREAHPNDILMSVAGSIGALCICDKTISLGRAAVAFRPKTKHVAYCYFIIKKFINRMLSVSSGSIQKVVNDSHIDEINFPYNEEIVSKFDFANQIIEKCIKLTQENNELIKLRNELLPLLMNGQVSII